MRKRSGWKKVIAIEIYQRYTVLRNGDEWATAYSPGIGFDEYDSAQGITEQLYAMAKGLL